MAMIKCLECKKSISSDADKCPNCGTENTSTSKVWINGIASLVVIFLVYYFFFS